MFVVYCVSVQFHTIQVCYGGAHHPQRQLEMHLCTPGPTMKISHSFHTPDEYLPTPADLARLQSLPQGHPGYPCYAVHYDLLGTALTPIMKVLDVTPA